MRQAAERDGDAAGRPGGGDAVSECPAAAAAAGADGPAAGDGVRDRVAHLAPAKAAAGPSGEAPAGGRMCPMRGTTAGSRWRCGSAARPIRRGGADGGARSGSWWPPGSAAGGTLPLPPGTWRYTARCIESVFQRDGIPAYISRRSDILAKPPLTMLLGAVDAVTGGFRQEDMFRYLKTGMAGITAEECDLLENYVIAVEHPGEYVAAGRGVDGKPRRLRAGDDPGAAAAAGGGQPHTAEGALYRCCP